MFPPGFGFPPQIRGQRQIFQTATNNQATATSQHTGESAIWHKPAWATCHTFLLVGSAGGGAGGVTGLTSSARAGSGGGGSSHGAFAMNVASCFLPSSLRIILGKGGAGGTATNNGTQGGYSAIALPATSNSSGQFGYVLTVTGGGGGTAGAAGTGGAGGAAGALGALFALAAMGGFAATSNALVWTATAGGTGSTAGGSAAAGTATGQVPLWSGCGGGAATVGNGFSVGANGSNHPFPPQTFAQGGATAGANGEPQRWQGFESEQMFICSPPGGGAGNGAGTGGTGGDAYYGAGGGGGGGGITGGAGGKGGDGFCIIWSY